MEIQAKGASGYEDALDIAAETGDVAITVDGMRLVVTDATARALEIARVSFAYLGFLLKYCQPYKL